MTSNFFTNTNGYYQYSILEEKTNFFSLLFFIPFILVMIIAFIITIKDLKENHSNKKELLELIFKIVIGSVIFVVVFAFMINSITQLQKYKSVIENNEYNKTVGCVEDLVLYKSKVGYIDGYEASFKLNDILFDTYWMYGTGNRLTKSDCELLKGKELTILYTKNNYDENVILFIEIH